jgi:hypothetical protein
MDISKFNFKDGAAARMELCHPATGEVLKDDNGAAIWIDVYGSDSDVFRGALRSYGNKKLAKGSKKQTMEELEQVSSKILAKATAGWSDQLMVNGDFLPCTEQNAEWLYCEYPWIREQIDTFVNERSNFLKSA